MAQRAPLPRLHPTERALSQPPHHPGQLSPPPHGSWPPRDRTARGGEGPRAQTREEGSGFLLLGSGPGLSFVAEESEQLGRSQKSPKEARMDRQTDTLREGKREGDRQEGGRRELTTARPADGEIGVSARILQRQICFRKLAQVVVGLASLTAAGQAWWDSGRSGCRSLGNFFFPEKRSLGFGGLRLVR